MLGVVESTAPPIERYDPGNPQANEQGIVYAANVNAMEEMANMISASRSYQSNLEVINTAKDLMLRTLTLGRLGAHMVDSIGSGLDLSGLGLAPAQAAKKDGLGQEEFLNLMVTQLKNQDPFKPLESGEFLGQLAQFGTVSGLAELKTSFSELAGSLVSNQALQAASLVGRKRDLVASSTAHARQGRRRSAARDLTRSGQRGPDSNQRREGSGGRQLDSAVTGKGLRAFHLGRSHGRRRRCASGRLQARRRIIAGNEMAAETVTAPVESVVFGPQGFTVLSTRIGRAAVQRSARDPQR